MGKNIAETPDVTEQIKENIRRTEASITDTLHTIEHRFTPAHIKSELKGKIRHYALIGLVKANDAVREKKVQRAIVGAGAAIFALNKLTKGGRKPSAAAKGSAVIEALPERVKKNPVEGIRHYVTMGRVVLAVASTLGTMLLRQKREAAPPVARPSFVPTPRVYHGGIHGNVME